MSEATTVQEAEIVNADVSNVNETTKPEPQKESPAKDLREIQALLVNGIFPGNVAPQVVKAFHLLDQMCLTIEKAANEPK